MFFFLFSGQSETFEIKHRFQSMRFTIRDALTIHRNLQSTNQRAMQPTKKIALIYGNRFAVYHVLRI